jgi:hypothetical protein
MKKFLTGFTKHTAIEAYVAIKGGTYCFIFCKVILNIENYFSFYFKIT